jgi:glycosyltransferase involved in cell wall biosynthesis
VFVHIAIVVPAFNVAHYLRDCLLSLLGQTHTDWSAVVVDDGSMDATSAVATRCSDSRIRLLWQRNAGVSAARNAGIAAALDYASPGLGVAPDAFLFLDGDDWLAPGALSLLAEALEAAPLAVAATGRYARVALTDSARSRGRALPWSLPSWPLPSRLGASCLPSGWLLGQLMTRNLFANGGHLLIRREAVEAAGNFRTDLSYGEDWEYWVRLAVLGRFTAVPSRTPLLFVRERPGSAYLSHGTDPDAYRPALNAIYMNPGVVDRVGDRRLVDLRRRADAETAWSVGRELIRHGNRSEGCQWLWRSIRDAPNLKRLALIILSRFQFGRFRPYRAAG